METAVYRTLFKKESLVKLWGKINDDNVFNGAAALAYYSLFSLFPAMIFLLSLLPYLPIENLHQAIMEFLAQILPSQVTKQVEGVIAEVTLNKRTGLLSIGALLTLWAASSGVYALMEQLDMTYHVKEQRPFWKARGLAMILTISLAVLVIVSFALIVLGGVVQGWLANYFGENQLILFAFAAFRWIVIFTLMLLSFAITYYFGPDVEQKFKFITPGAVIGVLVLIAAALTFRFYVENFGDYAATYGSLGAVIVLMLLLYIGGLVVLTGSSINAMIEHQSAEGKNLGEKDEPQGPRPKKPMPPPKNGRKAPAQSGGYPEPATFRTRQEGQGSSVFGLLLGVLALGLASRKQSYRP